MRKSSVTKIVESISISPIVSVYVKSLFTIQQNHHSFVQIIITKFAVC